MNASLRNIQLESANDLESAVAAEKRQTPRKIYDLSVNEHGTLYYWWSICVSTACLYNILAVTLLVFEDVRRNFYTHWLLGNTLADVVYLIDIIVQSRISFYEGGIKMIAAAQTRGHYFTGFNFFLDVSSLLPLDVLLFVRSDISLLRANRLCKCYRMAETFALTERRTTTKSLQSSMSIGKMIFLCSVLFHWNACAYYVLSDWSGIHESDEDDWAFNFEKIADVFYSGCRQPTCLFNETGRDVEEREEYLTDLVDHWSNFTIHLPFSNLAKEYALSIYWSSMTMSTMGEQPWPQRSFQNLYEVMNTLVGMLIFAGIMGAVGDLVANSNASKVEIQLRMDGLKQYMNYRQVTEVLSKRVLAYLSYELAQKETVDEEKIKRVIPRHVLIRVNPFLQWRALAESPLFMRPFLSDLATRLQLLQFAPDDVISARGDLSKEMYIVRSGEVCVVNEDDKVEKILGEGEVFGDSALFWQPDHRFSNRRMVTLVSLGYTDIYTLHRDQLLQVLEDYPTLVPKLQTRARTFLAAKGELTDATVDSSEDYENERDLRGRLEIIQILVQNLERELERRYQRFKKNSSELKKRVFQLEKIVWNNRDAIRRDFASRRR